jgi:Holliday junction resolvase RusA-like endonuclease
VIAVTRLVFVVAGIPIPQGSKSAGVRGGNAFMFDQNKGLKPWRKTVTQAAAAAHTGAPLVGPLSVRIEFCLPSPKRIPADRQGLPSIRPDLDKLVRSIFDAVTDAKAWGDDGQVVELVALKTYSDQPGAVVRVGPYIPEGATA